MYLPMQREPVQRSIAGLRSDNQGCAFAPTVPGASDRAGIEPSDWLHDILNKNKLQEVIDQGGPAGLRLGMF
jgi:hypothetical protein